MRADFSGSSVAIQVPFEKQSVIKCKSLTYCTGHQNSNNDH